MENKKEEKKVWLYGFVFLIFGLVLGLLIFNSGISGNAIFNVGKTAITPVETPSTTAMGTALITVSPNITLGQMCEKIGYINEEGLPIYFIDYTKELVSRGLLTKENAMKIKIYSDAVGLIGISKQSGVGNGNEINVDEGGGGQGCYYNAHCNVQCSQCEPPLVSNNICVIPYSGQLGYCRCGCKQPPSWWRRMFGE